MILQRYHDLVERRENDEKRKQEIDRKEMERQDALLAAKLLREEMGRFGKRTIRKATQTASKIKSSKSKSNTKRLAPNNAFNREMALSPELTNVIGVDKCSRPQVVKLLWAYIKDHNLQNPQDKRQIECDEKLQKLFKKVCYITMLFIYISQDLLWTKILLTKNDFSRECWCIPYE